MPTDLFVPLQINSQCSAGCLHCPYSKGVPTFQPAEVLLQTISESKSVGFLLTGGEPIEHPDFWSIIDTLEQNSKSYRIATGGFIDFFEHLPSLIGNSGFLGFSLGTDVLIDSRNFNSTLREIWRRNVRTFEAWKIPYSLTFTLGNSWKIDDILVYIDGLNPGYLVLAETEGESELQMNEVIRTLDSKFREVPVRYGYRN